MNDIMTNKQNHTLNSTEVAKMIGKEHSELLKDIRRYTRQIDEANFSLISNETNFGSVNEGKIPLVEFFIESTYIDSKGQTRPAYKITLKGCEFIANKLTGTKGTAFTARYVNRFHEMEDGLTTTLIAQTLNTMSSTLTVLTESVAAMNNRLDQIERQNVKALPERTQSRWGKTTFRKLYAIKDCINERLNEDYEVKDIISSSIIEMENTYDIDFNEFVNDYQCEFFSDVKPYPLTVIDHYREIRKMYTLTLDSVLERLDISFEPVCRKTIFDDIFVKRDKNEKEE